MPTTAILGTCLFKRLGTIQQVGQKCWKLTDDPHESTMVGMNGNGWNEWQWYNSSGKSNAPHVCSTASTNTYTVGIPAFEVDAVCRQKQEHKYGLFVDSKSVMNPGHYSRLQHVTTCNVPAFPVQASRLPIKLGRNRRTETCQNCIVSAFLICWQHTHLSAHSSSAFARPCEPYEACVLRAPQASSTHPRRTRR